MADRYPLVVDSSNYRVEEIPSGDSLDLQATTVKNATFVGVATFSEALFTDSTNNVVISGVGSIGINTNAVRESLYVRGNASFQRDFDTFSNSAKIGVGTFVSEGTLTGIGSTTSWGPENNLIEFCGSSSKSLGYIAFNNPYAPQSFLYWGGYYGADGETHYKWDRTDTVGFGAFGRDTSGDFVWFNNNQVGVAGSIIPLGQKSQQQMILTGSGPGISTQSRGSYLGINTGAPGVLIDAACRQISNEAATVRVTRNDATGPAYFVARSDAASTAAVFQGYANSVGYGYSSVGYIRMYGAGAASSGNGLKGLMAFHVTDDSSDPSAEAMRINDAGELLIGYTADNGAYKLQVNSQIFATSATVATSDGNYKENVSPLNGCLSIVDSLNPVSFTWKEQQDVVGVDEEGKTTVLRPAHNFPQGTQVGFIAQEVQEVLSDKEYLGSIVKENSRPAVIDGGGNELAPQEDFLGLAEGNLVALLVGAVKELKAENEALKARLDAAGI
jgi:hypothetical protein